MRSYIVLVFGADAFRQSSRTDGTCAGHTAPLGVFLVQARICEVLVDSDVTIKASLDFQLESLILAQNERWRQA